MRLYFPAHWTTDAPTPTLAAGWPALSHRQAGAILHRYPGSLFVEPGTMTLCEAMRALGTLPRGS